MSSENHIVASVETLAIIGVGLIGGSVALAARERGVAQRVIGLGRNAARLEQARSWGIIDEGVTDYALLADADLVIVCSPVDRIVQDALAAAAVTAEETLISDVGSVKGAICEQLAVRLPARFVGSHPLAGSEKGGFENAQADLFEGRVCIVTPTAETPPQLVERMTQFWQSLGMRLLQQSPQAHDRVLAITSHVPHVAAAAVASLLSDEAAPFASSGFRDTTRVAAGDPQLWAAILSQNAPEVQRVLAALMLQLDRFGDVLANGDLAQLQQLLLEGQMRREVFETAFGNSVSKTTT